MSWVELVWLPLPPSPSSVVICWWFLCWWVSRPGRYPGVHSFYLPFFCDWLDGEGKMVKTAGVYSMIFKVSSHRGEIGDALDMYSVNCDISTNWPLFRNGGNKLRLLLVGGRIGSWV